MKQHTSLLEIGVLEKRVLNDGYTQSQINQQTCKHCNLCKRTRTIKPKYVRGEYIGKINKKRPW